MKKITITNIIFIGIILILVFFFLRDILKEIEFGRSNINWAQTGTSHDDILVGTSVTEVLSADTGRNYAYLCNADTVANQLIYLYFGTASTSAAVDEGVRLNSGECFEIDSEFLWVGEIWGIASPSATSISYMIY